MKYEELFKSQKTIHSPQIVHLGARGSILSRWQANHIAQKLEQIWPHLQVKTQIIQTQGDQISEIPLPQIGGKGIFTLELEQAMHQNRIDLAVHSFKDLPVKNASDLTIAAISEREDPRDAFISRQNYRVHTLPKGARIGTSSTRRAAQLLFLRPDLNITHIRGNIDTRVKKALDPNAPYDGIVVAYAGLLRIDLAHVCSEIINVDQMLPAPAQGALAIQCKGNSPLLPLLESINHDETMLSTVAERSFLSELGGGCSLPVAAFAEHTDGMLSLRGNVLARNGCARIDLEMSIPVDLKNIKEASSKASTLGELLAKKAMEKGADKLLADC